MTMIDYALMAASAAAILIVAAYWWRRAPETARIVATEVGWCLGSFYAALYVWSQLAGSRPLRVVAIGMFALGGRQVRQHLLDVVALDPPRPRRRRREPGEIHEVGRGAASVEDLQQIRERVPAVVAGRGGVRLAPLPQLIVEGVQRAPGAAVPSARLRAARQLSGHRHAVRRPPLAPRPALLSQAGLPARRPSLPTGAPARPESCRWSSPSRTSSRSCPGSRAVLDDEAVSQVMVNGPAAVYVERAGRLGALEAPALTAEAVAGAAIQIARPLGEDPATDPIIDARLADGSRVAVCSPPAAPATAITIRRFGGRAFTIEELTASGSLPPAVVEAAVAVLGAERNVLISGGTGSGKTTLLGALVSLLQAAGRVISIEDTLELRLRRVNCLRFEACGLAGRGVTIRDLVRHALRHRPDHIVVGEVCGAEAADPPSGAEHGARRVAGHRAREQRRGGAIAPGDLRHAGEQRAALGGGLPGRCRRHRGRHSPNADGGGDPPRRPDGARAGLRRAREPMGRRANLARPGRGVRGLRRRTGAGQAAAAPGADASRRPAAEAVTSGKDGGAGMSERDESGAEERPPYG